MLSLEQTFPAEKPLAAPRVLGELEAALAAALQHQLPPEEPPRPASCRVRQFPGSRAISDPSIALKKVRTGTPGN